MVSSSEQRASASDDAQDERRKRKVRRAKRRIRPELSVSKGEWAKRGYALSNVLSLEGVEDSLPRVDVRTTSWELFVRTFEEPRRPCILTHAMEDWPSLHGERAWTWQALRTRFADHQFKCGSDDDGYAVRLRTEHFVDYVSDSGPEGVRRQVPPPGQSSLGPLQAARDDSPLYIFDSGLCKPGCRSLLDDFSVPPYFREDLFALTGEKRRPPHRWVVFGPARSGSSLHIDPLATSAWNALLLGTKRWVLLPPGVPRASCKPRIPGVTDGEAVTWFTHILPLCTAADWPHARPVQCIQRRGEIMYVPNGWWHAVLNTSNTIAVTQNFVSSSNFEAAWRHTLVARPKLSVRWLAALRSSRPDLAAIADAVVAEGKPCLSESSPSSSSTSSSSDSSSDEDKQAKPPPKHARKALD